MLIRELQLTNFQAHEETVLQFSRYITTIKGPTDAGKSAILRALRWALLNDFAGADFIREGAKRAAVRLVVVHERERVTIQRERNTRSDNLYVLEGEEFKAFGTGVPKEIADIVCMSALNFQGQHDAPFWLSEGGIEVSRQLNAVIDLSIIDTALSTAARRVYRATENKKITESRLADAKKQLEELEPQRARIDEFWMVIKKKDKWEGCRQLSSRLKELVNKVENTEAPLLKEFHSEGSICLKHAAKIVETRKKIATLKDIIYGIQTNYQCEAPPDFGPVEDARTKYMDAYEDTRVLRTLLSNINFALEQKDKAWKVYAKKHQAFYHKTAGTKCPTCGQTMT